MAGVLMTKRDTFLPREQFMQLLYGACCSSRPGTDGGGTGASAKLDVPPPALLRPQVLFTGKQVGASHRQSSVALAPTPHHRTVFTSTSLRLCPAHCLAWCFRCHIIGQARSVFATLPSNPAFINRHVAS